MSEQANIFYFEQKIRDSKNNAKAGYLIFVLGLVLISISFVFVLWGDAPNFTGIIIGGLFCIIGLVAGFYENHESSKYAEELRKIATVKPACPNCKRELPQGTFDFCPYCGNCLRT